MIAAKEARHDPPGDVQAAGRPRRGRTRLAEIDVFVDPDGLTAASARDELLRARLELGFVEPF
jgi:hypothetical protein